MCQQYISIPATSTLIITLWYYSVAVLCSTTPPHTHRHAGSLSHRALKVLLPHGRSELDQRERLDELLVERVGDALDALVDDDLGAVVEALNVSELAWGEGVERSRREEEASIGGGFSWMNEGREDPHQTGGDRVGTADPGAGRAGAGSRDKHSLGPPHP